ncbi:MAG: outer membrane beta-barrel protein [Acidobacteriaceae bacterium]
MQVQIDSAHQCTHSTHQYTYPTKSSLPTRSAWRYIFWLILLAVVCSLSGVARAQYNASLQGTVLDPTGAVVPGATVTLTDKETNFAKTATTDSKGIYTFNALPPNHFSIQVSAPGFQKQVLRDVLLVPEQSNSVNVTLALGQASQTVTVSSGSPLLQTESASISGTITSNEVQHLPSFGRDVFQLSQLAPGVFGDGSQAAGGGTNSLPASNMSGSTNNSGIFKTENAPQISGNGGQNQTNGISIDGISTESAVWGGASVITPTEESVKDVQIVSNSYDASEGRFSGAQTKIITKGGTNNLHGSAFFLATRPGLNAYQAWNGPGSFSSGTPASRGVLKDTQRFNQFGGSLGGPFWRNKLFGFFAWETLRNSSINTGTGWYETNQFNQLGPTGSIASSLLTFPGEAVASSSIIAGASTCAEAGLQEGTQCRTIPGQGINLGSPLTTPLGTLDPTYTGSGNPGIGSGLTNVPTIADYSTAFPATDINNQYNGRVDANITKKDLVFGTIYWVPVTDTYYNGPIRAANLWHHTQVNDAFTMEWDHTFSPTLLNQARANAAGWRWNEVTSNPQEAWGLPQASINNLGSIGVNSFGAPGPSIFDQWTYSYDDVLTKVQGSHNLKFGGGATRLYYLNEAPWAGRPSWNFRNMWDVLNDAPYGEGGAFNPATGVQTINRQDDRVTMYDGFVQDDYKVLPNLTVNLGLRWSYFGPMSSKEGNLSVLELGTAQNLLTDAKLRIGGNLYKAQKGNFGPQVGFAWSPDQEHNKLVIRGGFGLNYNQNELAIQANGTFNPPNIIQPFLCCASSTVTPGSVGIVYQVPSSPSSFYGYPANPNVIATYNTSNLPESGSPIGVTGFPSSIPTTYTYHYSLGGQYDLGQNWVASLGYSGSMSRHLIRQYNYNALAAAVGIPFNPKLGSVDFYSNDSNSAYNSMLAGLQHQFARWFQADIEYDWSKSMDDGSQPYSEEPYPEHRRANWGRSDYNVQNAFKISGLWQPVFFHGNSWLEKTVGGWSLGGIMNLHTGFPWTPLYSNTQCNLYYEGSGYCNLYPGKYLGGAGHDKSNTAFESGPQSPTGGFNKNYSRGALNYFTVPAFTLPTGPFPLTAPPPPLPGVARNFLTGPGYKDVDITLIKDFGFPKMRVLGNGAILDVRMDAFNLFNNVNLINISNNISNDGIHSTQNFGQAQGALGSRTVELQARFQF